ncbi:MAG TPA: division/cell wall cluster transcriptional repressor MraZ [Acidimicrobiales bacterium]|nr:division/cell wall cluster transcriptional repressor MraZ [Acidimicrobiales bacterium]
MARFFGRYEHSLDPKGRVILPAKFRAAFERGGYLTQFHDRCLALWTPEDFDKQMEAMERAEEQGRTERNLARLWAQGTHEVDVDRQGRIAIPQYLRDFARLDGDVLVNGAITRIELWSPTIWQEKVAPSEARLTEDEDES